MDKIKEFAKKNVYDSAYGPTYRYARSACDSVNLPVFRDDRLKIDKKHQLGKGRSSKVYLSTILKSQENDQEKQVAFKLFKNPEDVSDEVELMADLDHPNIIKLLGCVLPPFQPGLVLELMSRTLSDYIFAEKTKTPNLTERMNIAQGIVNGLLYLHVVRGMIHCDPAPTNVLLDNQNQPKISDFGLAMKGTTCPTPWVMGYGRYLPPEVYNKPEKGHALTYTQKIDVYIVALTLHSLLINFQDHIFLPEQDHAAVHKLHMAGILKVLKLNEEKPVEKVLSYCLDRNPDTRSSTQMLKENLALVAPCYI